LKFFYMEDDGGGLLMSSVHPDVKAAVAKVTRFNSCPVALSCLRISILAMMYCREMDINYLVL